MNVMEKIIQDASKKGKTVILPESHDERVLKAANKIIKMNLASVIIIGNENKIKEDLNKLNLNPDRLKIIDPEKSEYSEKFSEIYFELRKKKGITKEEAKQTVKRDIFFAALMIREGLADGSVEGSTASTADVMKAGIQCIGIPDGVSIVSSFFLMILPEKTYSFADCAVVPNPDYQQLADIAITTAGNHKKLTGEEPCVAMLSFSTKGSAQHELVDKVIQATELVRQKAPHLKIDGELQFDAAVIESIGKRKAPESRVAGKANVLIFPDLNAGNIGYKIAERLGKAEAVGPIIQGLKKPYFDLSRGCSVDDIVNTAAIAVLMS